MYSEGDSDDQYGDGQEEQEKVEDEDEESFEQIEFGRGLANYNSQEIDRIKGHKR